MELGSSSGGSSDFLRCCRGDGGSSFVGGAWSADLKSSSVIGAAVGEPGGVTCLAAGGDGGRWLMGDSRLWRSSFVEGGGDSGGGDASTSGEGCGSVGATSFLISGGESGGVVGFSGWLGGSERRLDIGSVEKILGFGARGGLDLGRGSFSRVSSEEEEMEVLGDGGGLGEEVGGD